MVLEVIYGWYMKCDGKYLCCVVVFLVLCQIIESVVIELLLKEGYVVICSGGGGVFVVGEGEGVEVVIDKDLVVVLLVEQIVVDGLIILMDVDVVYEYWGMLQQCVICQVLFDELVLFVKVDGVMGLKVIVVSGYVKWCGKLVWIGVLLCIDDILVGRVGICICL